MDNETVAAVLKEAQRFWLKWRNQVPSRDSEQWDELSSEAGIIKQRYGTRMVRKWEGPTPTLEEEPVAAPIVNWFMDELEARERAEYGGEKLDGQEGREKETARV
jgi:hypothetical protein